MSKRRVEAVWIEAEHWPQDCKDATDEKTEVVVTFRDGSTWAASFATYRHLEFVERNHGPGGLFEHRRVVPVEQMNRDEIEAVVYDLILEGDFENFFQSCDD